MESHAPKSMWAAQMRLDGFKRKKKKRGYKVHQVGRAEMGAGKYDQNTNMKFSKN